jgi:hypothetical protein
VEMPDLQTSFLHPKSRAAKAAQYRHPIIGPKENSR